MSSQPQRKHTRPFESLRARASGGSQETAPKRRVLLVDDDENLSTFLARALRAIDCSVELARDGLEASRKLEATPYDVIVTDISMPRMNGVELLRAIRKSDVDVPVVVLTGAADVSSAARAVEYGAFRYLEKPVSPSQIQEVVQRAADVHALARRKRWALSLLRDRADAASRRARSSAALTSALGSLYALFQPIVRRSTRSVFAYEALARSRSAALSGPHSLLDAAESLGRMEELGRMIRERVARAIPLLPEGQLVFVNVHPLELADDGLLSETAPLSAHAGRVVLEITERVQLERVPELDERVRALRALGYRLAVDDLGAGYAGLSSFVRLSPEFVKIDPSLTRDIDRSTEQQTLMRSTLDLCRCMSVGTVVEGVETGAELRTLSLLGAELLQGYRFGAPGSAFPAVASVAFEV